MPNKINKTLLTKIIDNSMQGILVADKNGNIVLVNRAHETLTGTPVHEDMGKNIKVLTETGIMSESSTERVLETGKPVIMEQMLHRDTEEERTIIIRAVPIVDEEGEIEFVINYLSDITDKNKVIKELNQVATEKEKYVIELQQLRQRAKEGKELVYRSPAMMELVERAIRVAPMDSTVLLMGESGTGKEVFARLIHRNSRRKDKVFLSVNCGAIPESLLESELFGYEKGAFSGAHDEGKKGIFEYADTGTLLLDEIGDMPYALQVKLLRVLQEGEITRIGSNEPVSVDVRIIAATNMDLEKKISEKTFRKDLYYRLNVIPLRIPPLRERPDDISVLVAHFAETFNLRYGMRKEFSSAAIECMMNMNFTGNVRELENITERTMLFADSNVISPRDIIKDKEFSDMLITGSQGCYENEGGYGGVTGHTDEIKNLPEALESYEKRILEACVKMHKTTKEVGRVLGMDQSTISRKLKKHNIKL